MFSKALGPLKANLEQDCEFPSPMKSAESGLVLIKSGSDSTRWQDTRGLCIKRFLHSTQPFCRGDMASY